LGVEGVDRSCIETFRDSLKGMADDYDVCIIDIPPALTNRTFGALLAADAVLAPIGINDYSLAGIAELLRAIKGVSVHYKRAEPAFLGLLPSLYDRKSRPVWEHPNGRQHRPRHPARRSTRRLPGDFGRTADEFP